MINQYKIYKPQKNNMLMDENKIIVKNEKIFGTLMILIALIMEIYILLLSSSKNIHLLKSIYSAIILILIQIIPVGIFEVGYYHTKKAKKMELINLNTKNKLNRNDLMIYKKGLKLSKIVLYIVIYSLIVSAIFIFISLKEFTFSTRTLYILIGLFIYIILIRPASISFYENSRNKKRSFLTNLAFWIGIGTSISGITITYFAINKNHPLTIWLPAILFTLTGPIIIYTSIFKKYVKYEFKEGNLYLEFPVTTGKDLKAAIPVNKITKCIKINSLDYEIQNNSYTHPFIRQINNISNYIDFVKGKAPYPSKFIAGNAEPRVYLKGSDFDIVISVKDADKFIKEIDSCRKQQKRTT